MTKSKLTAKAKVENGPLGNFEMKAAPRVLIAGIGNIFFGDDAFGCEVAHELMTRSWPESVRVFDYGIRSYDLAFAMTEPNDAVILIDAAPRGELPGTIYLLELDINNVDSAEGEVLNAHGMNPIRVLQLARSLGGCAGQLYLVGCEPEILETEEGAIGLSAKVRAAVPSAIDMIEELLNNLFHGNENAEADVAGLETRAEKSGRKAQRR